MKIWIIIIYYMPDPTALKNGVVSFEVLHHSLFGIANVDMETLLDEWTKRAADNIVTRNTADGNK